MNLSRAVIIFTSFVFIFVGCGPHYKHKRYHQPSNVMTAAQYAAIQNGEPIQVLKEEYSKINDLYNQETGKCDNESSKPCLVTGGVVFKSADHKGYYYINFTNSYVHLKQFYPKK